MINDLTSQSNQIVCKWYDCRLKNNTATTTNRSRSILPWGRMGICLFCLHELHSQHVWLGQTPLTECCSAIFLLTLLILFAVMKQTLNHIGHTLPLKTGPRSLASHPLLSQAQDVPSNYPSQGYGEDKNKELHFGCSVYQVTMQKSFHDFNCQGSVKLQLLYVGEPSSASQF